MQWYHSRVVSLLCLWHNMSAKILYVVIFAVCRQRSQHTYENVPHVFFASNCLCIIWCCIIASLAAYYIGRHSSRKWRLGLLRLGVLLDDAVYDYIKLMHPEIEIADIGVEKWSIFFYEILQRRSLCSYKIMIIYHDFQFSMFLNNKWNIYPGNISQYKPKKLFYAFAKLKDRTSCRFLKNFVSAFGNPHDFFVFDTVW